MGRFQIPSTPPTINKTIRFPSDVVEVIAAVRTALEDVQETEMSGLVRHP